MGSYLKINPKTIGIVTREQEERLKEATELIEVILNSKIFYQELLKLDLSSTRGLTPSEVYLTIMEGAETANGEKDFEMDLNVMFFFRDSAVGGMASVESNIVKINTKFFGKRSLATDCSTLVHEWLHNLSFKHTSSEDHTSVPYAVGFLVKELVGKYHSKIKKLGKRQEKQRFIIKKWLWGLFTCYRWK